MQSRRYRSFTFRQSIPPAPKPRPHRTRHQNTQAPPAPASQSQHLRSFFAPSVGTAQPPPARWPDLPALQPLHSLTHSASPTRRRALARSDGRKLARPSLTAHCPKGPTSSLRSSRGANLRPTSVRADRARSGTTRPTRSRGFARPSNRSMGAMLRMSPRTPPYGRVASPGPDAAVVSPACETSPFRSGFAFTKQAGLAAPPFLSETPALALRGLLSRLPCPPSRPSFRYVPVPGIRKR